jgi:Raf kinase inhibitor-like YbhB/YbcL family protein
MYRKSLSNLLGRSLLAAATVAALNACGSEPGTGGMTPTGGTTAPPSGGTTGSAGTAGKPPSTAGAPAGMAGKGAAGTGMMGNPIGTAGTGAAGAAAGSGAAAGGGAAGMAAAGSTAAGSGAAGGAAGGGAAPGGTLGGELKYTGEFTMGTTITAVNKCPMPAGGGMGMNKSPKLSWTGGPAETKSFAVVLFDTGFDMLHWVLWDIPATVNELPEGLAAGYELSNPMGAHQAAAMCMNAPAYCGPCSGGAVAGIAKYEYRLYALSKDKLDLTESSTAAQAQSAVEAAMLDSVVWEGMSEM